MVVTVKIYDGDLKLDRNQEGLLEEVGPMREAITLYAIATTLQEEFYICNIALRL